MWRYIAKRFTWGIFTLFIFITVVFFAVQLVMPYDFTAQFAMQMDAAELTELQESLGLDQPIWTRYWDWLTRIVRLDFSRSYRGENVSRYLWEALGYSLVFLLFGTLVSFFIGQQLGKWMAWKRQGGITNVVTLLSLVFYTTFPPWLAYIITLIFVPKLRGWLNVGIESLADMLGVVDLTIMSISAIGDWEPLDILLFIMLSLLGGTLLLIGLNALLNRFNRRPIPWYVGLFLVILISGGVVYWSGYANAVQKVLLASSLPVVTYVLMSYSEIMMIMRTSMEDILDDDFINVAQAKGIPDRLIRDKHALRNAILPVLSRLVVTIPYMLTGIVILEYTFDWPGMGRSLWFAIQSQDLPLILGFFLFIGMITLIARLVLDILHITLDPRQRLVENHIPRRKINSTNDEQQFLQDDYRSIPGLYPDRALIVAKNLIDKNRAQQAQQILIDFLKRNPLSDTGWYLLSRTISDQTDSIYTLQQALRINPHHIPARHRLASIQKKNNQSRSRFPQVNENIPSIRSNPEAGIRISAAIPYHRSRMGRLRNRIQLTIQRIKWNWDVFIRSRLALFGLGILVVFILMIIARPILMNYVWLRSVFDPVTGYDAKITHPADPSWKHLLGTTFRGRDVFSLLLLATQNSFALGLTAGGIAAITGTITGVLAAYHRGLMDEGLSQLFDVILLLPAPIFMAFAGASLRDLGPVLLGVIYGLIAGLGPVAILMRTHALAIVSRPYIEAAKVSGGRSGHIILHHVLPHMYPMALLQMLLTVTSAVIVDGFLSFLGVSRYIINWGTMLYESAIIVEYFGGGLPWNIYLAPIFAFSLFGLAFYLLSRGMQRIANPRIREKWI